MPIYEYECKNCGGRFERVQPVTAPPVAECINCGQGPVRRVFHPVGVIFKGSGWYITDSRKSGPSKNGAGGDSRSESKDKEGAASTPGSSDAD